MNCSYLYIKALNSKYKFYLTLYPNRKKAQDKGLDTRVTPFSVLVGHGILKFGSSNRVGSQPQLPYFWDSWLLQSQLKCSARCLSWLDKEIQKS